MLLYFSVIGGLLYKIFLKSPEMKNTPTPLMPPPLSNNEAAGMHAR